MQKQIFDLTIKNIKKDYEALQHPGWDRHSKFSKNVCLRAEVSHAEVKATLFDIWRTRISLFENKVFKDCKVLNGMSKNAFLKRFLTYRPLNNTAKLECGQHLTKLSDSLRVEEVIKKSFLQNSDVLDNLCSSFITIEWRNQSMDWIKDHSTQLWMNISQCLELKDNLIVPEICIATAFIVYSIDGNISESIIHVFIKLANIVIECCRGLDDYVMTYNEANEAFFSGRKHNRPFFFPSYTAHNVDYMLLSTAFYCQAFILNFYLSCSIYEHFLPIIEEMTDVTKYLELDLLTQSVENLGQMLDTNSEKENILNLVEFIFENTINFQIDRNAANKKSIININSLLRNTFQTHNPTVLTKVRRKSSNDMKIVITLRKNKLEKEAVNSLNSTFFYSELN